MDETNQNNISCSMCYFTGLGMKDLIKHVVRNHKNDPKFKIKCSEQGCGVTYTKWKSFRQHLFRKHSLNRLEVCDSIEEEGHYHESVNEDEFEHDLAADDFDYSIDYLQSCAAQFIVTIRETCKISSSCTQKIIDGVTYLVNVYSGLVQQEIKKTQNAELQTIHVMDVNRICQVECHPSIIFSSVHTKNSLDKVLVEKFKMILPVKIKLVTSLKWKKKKNCTEKIHKVAYEVEIIPFLDSLKTLLSNKEVRSYIGKKSNDNILRTVLDGSYYNENEFFSQNPNSLAILMYYDDVGMTNPLAGAAKIHKQAMFYWTLANLEPKVRSIADTVQLYCIVNTEYLKRQNGLKKILEPFIEDIKTLQSTGIDIDIGGGKVQNFKASLLFCPGDTPASALLGGFKESTAAYRLCRSCHCTRDTWKLYFYDDDYIPRTNATHQEHLQMINNDTITPQAKEFWQKYFGINKTSPLMDIPHFDITACLPQDAMHVLIEGVIELSCRLYLTYCIKDLKLFTVEDFNKKLSSFNFKHFKRDKPAPIQSKHLDNRGTLRQSAAQLLTLAHTLPFLIGEWVMVCREPGLFERAACYTRMLQVLNFCLAYEIQKDSIELSKRMIAIFISTFIDLYPDCLIPKFHYLIHIPRYIKLFGPSRQQWCFRFEAAHAYFKSLVSVVRNFKNISKTLIYRHQSRLCCKLNSYPGMPVKNFLYQDDDVAPGKSMLLNDFPFVKFLNAFVDETERPSCRIMVSPKIVVYGTSYYSGCIILIKCNDNDMPLFGEVINIVVIDKMKLIVVTVLETECYEMKLNAYIVEKCNQITTFNVEELIFPHPLSSFVLMGKKYVPLVNHQRNEFYG